MEINRISNTAFQGSIRWRYGEMRPENLMRAIRENAVVNEFLGGKNDLLVTIKHRIASKHEVQKLSRDDDLYKVVFSRAAHSDSIFGKIFDFIFSRSVRLAKDFDHHSEHTNLRYLANEKHMKKIFSKLA